MPQPIRAPQAPAPPAAADRRPIPALASQPEHRGLDRARLFLGIGVLICTIVVFIPALGADFVDFDDGVLLVQNKAFRGLTPEHLRWMFSATVLGHYQPLTWLSYAIDYTISGPGLDPGQFHRSNVILHGLNAVLLFIVAMRLLAIARPQDDSPRLLRPVVAALVALLWAVHPLRVESVAWVTERRDVLSAFFLLLTVLAYLKAVAPGRPGIASAGWYLASILILVLSLLSKAWGMSFFVVALIIDWYPLRRLPEKPTRWLGRAARPVLLQKIPYAVLGIACATAAMYAQNAETARRTLEEWSIGSRIAQSFYGLLWYPGKTLWPTKLVALYELPKRLDPLTPKYLALGAGVLVLAGTVVLLRKKLPALAAGAAAFVVVILPVLGLSQAGDQLVADRYSYLAMMGPVLALGGGLMLILRSRAARLPLGLLAAAVLAGLGALTWRQSTYWETALTLWRHAVDARPDLMMAHINYSSNLVRLKRPDEALPHLYEAVRLRPDDGRGWFPLGVALRDIGDIDGAEHAYRESAKYLPQAYMPLVNLGKLLTNDRGKPDEGLAMYRLAVESVEHPRSGSKFSAKPYLVLGRALMVRGDVRGAREMLVKAAQYDETRGDATTFLNQLDGK